MMAAHIPWYRLMKAIQKRRHTSEEKRGKVFNEKMDLPKNLKKGTRKKPSIRVSPDLLSY
jgi:hypothetical protein